MQHVDIHYSRKQIIEYAKIIDTLLERRVDIHDPPPFLNVVSENPAYQFILDGCKEDPNGKRRYGLELKIPYGNYFTTPIRAFANLDGSMSLIELSTRNFFTGYKLAEDKNGFVWSFNLLRRQGLEAVAREIKRLSERQ